MTELVKEFDVTDGTCSVPDCDRPEVARGWCKSHYMRWYHNEARDRIACSSPKCDKPAQSRGLCGMHYNRRLRDATLPAINPTVQYVIPKPCRIFECGEVVHKRQLCRDHYLRLRNYGSPLGHERELCPQPPPRPKRSNTPRKIERACAWCGRVIERRPGDKFRPACSTRCSSALQFGRDRSEGRELVGPVSRRVDPVHIPASGVRFISISCRWCGGMFVFDRARRGRQPVHCSARCSTRAAWDGRGSKKFKISMKRRLAIYARDGWICQLCGNPVDPKIPHNDRMSATLDHIECQSWVLIPDHSDTNLRLAHLVCNSIRGDEALHRVVLTAKS